MTIQEKITLASAVIAVISMLVTVVIFRLNYNQAKRISEITLKSNYYTKIFDAYLIEKIPAARKYIRFQNDRLVDTNELVNVLTDMRRDALYFKYSNKSFYNKLKEITQKIEDYIMNCGNRNLEPEEQAGVFLEIHKMISELYSVIDEAHMGNT